MSFKYDEINGMSSAELTNVFAKEVEGSGGNVSLTFLADEIKRVESRESNNVMRKYTLWITIMTFIMLIGTLANIMLVFFGGK